MLPPSGWLGFSRNGVYEFSALDGSRRIDYVKGPEFEFLDGRGEWTEQGGLACTGSVARRTRASGAIELIDIYGNNRIAFRGPAAGTLTAFDSGGKRIGVVAAASPRPGWREFKPVPNGRSYVSSALRPSNSN